MPRNLIRDAHNSYVWYFEDITGHLRCSSEGRSSCLGVSQMRIQSVGCLGFRIGRSMHIYGIYNSESYIYIYIYVYIYALYTYIYIYIYREINKTHVEYRIRTFHRPCILVHEAVELRILPSCKMQVCSAALANYRRKRFWMSLYGEAANHAFNQSLLEQENLASDLQAV